MIRVKRVYLPPEPDDGKRFLVDRLWSRGVRKEKLQLDGWLRGVPPVTHCASGFATTRPGGRSFNDADKSVGL